MKVLTLKVLKLIFNTYLGVGLVVMLCLLAFSDLPFGEIWPTCLYWPLLLVFAFIMIFASLA